MCRSIHLRAKKRPDWIFDELVCINQVFIIKVSVILTLICHNARWNKTLAQHHYIFLSKILSNNLLLLWSTIWEGQVLVMAHNLAHSHHQLAEECPAYPHYESSCSCGHAAADVPTLPQLLTWAVWILARPRQRWNFEDKMTL